MAVAAATPVATATPAAAATPAASETAAPAGGGGVGVQLVPIAGEASADPRSLLYIMNHVAPGTTLSRQIEVSNNSAAGVAVNVYVSGADIQGGSFVGETGATQNELSSWMSTSPSELTVPANKTGLATVTITVPANAVAGERYAAIWAAVTTAPTSGSGVTQVNRVGIRTYLSVGAGGDPASDFTVSTITTSRQANGQPSVQAIVHNTGKRALDMYGTLTLTSGPGGLTAGPFAVTLGTTIPIDGSETIQVLLDKQVPVGPWHAKIVLRSGLIERTASSTISFPGAGSHENQSVALPLWGKISLGIGAITVLGGAGAMMAQAHRIRLRRPKARH
jgi:hypothetical protein